jgi:hypothetical protein
MLTRREFLAVTGPALLAWGRHPHQPRPPVIDGLGEIRPE